MLRLLIVDDEELIRKGLRKIISRCGTECEVIGEAENGRAALETIAANRPDVIITDIKMPVMDGIELIRNLEMDYSDIRKVVLSGFDEFSYVRDTMRRGALDYLLKPVDEDQVSELLKKIDVDLARENERRLSELDLRTKLNESYPLLRDRFVRELISEQAYTDEELPSRLSDYSIRMEPGTYVAIVVSMDNYGLLYEKLGAREARLKGLTVRKIAEESVGRSANFLSCFVNHDLVLAVSIPDDDPRRLSQIVDTLFADLRGSAGVRFTVSVGKGVRSPASLKTSYDSALALLRHRFYREGSSVINEDAAEARPPANGDISGVGERYVKRLERCVELANLQDTRKIVVDACADLAEKRCRPEEAVRMFVETHVKLRLAYPEFGRAAAALYGQEYSFAKAMERFDTLDEIRKYASGLYTDVVREIIDLRKRKDKKTVEVVKEYVSKHYDEDITLAAIADVVCLTPSYVCDLFRNRTGEHFVDYLTNVRMEKAKALLKDVTVKIYEVGLKVGYEDATYFSKVFKKTVGVTPREYRDLVE